MRRNELELLRRVFRDKQKWEFTAYILERKLNSLGVDVTAVMKADKDEVCQMLLEREEPPPIDSDTALFRP